MKSLESSNGKPLFLVILLEFLNDMKFSCDLWAVPEGRLVFAGEPLLRIKGPPFQCQLLETIILNIINFSNTHSYQGESHLLCCSRRCCA